MLRKIKVLSAAVVLAAVPISPAFAYCFGADDHCSYAVDYDPETNRTYYSFGCNDGQPPVMGSVSGDQEAAACAFWHTAIITSA